MSASPKSQAGSPGATPEEAKKGATRVTGGDDEEGKRRENSVKPATEARDDDADQLSDGESVLSEIDEAQFENFDPPADVDEANLKLIGRHKRKHTGEGDDGRPRRKDLDLCEQVTQAIRGQSETWNFIRSFTYHWVTPLEDGDGWSKADLSAAHERLGIQLPAAFKEAYTLFGRRSDLTRNQECLLGPTDLYLDHEALIFRRENQCAARWGILVADLQHHDPPVYIRHDLADKALEEWEPWLGRFSLACIDLILWESLYDSTMATDFRPINEEEFKLLEQLYTKLPSPDNLDSYTPYTICWFTGTDLLLCCTGTELYVRALTDTALRSIRRNLPGDWLLSRS